ncbi:DNA alkylation repair protein [Pseudoxanthomonas sp. z9]|uniref:DNA alkylation repair protein n=1 Tax=Pseudoxanthomonas sp. z9 TaxID=2584942 RepID=UPI0011424EAD|nr:DNA alkylation repair protein [Pseudoxanthomonas sp. z9]
MPATTKPARAAYRKAAVLEPVGADQALAMLKQQASASHRDGLARFGIPDEHALGVPMAKIQAIGKRIGRQPALAPALWDTGVYEARLLVAFVVDPARLSAAQMDRWCRDFDNWAVCDTLCFHLFDRSPHAWRKVAQWSGRRGEFEKRAAFALLAGLAVHDKATADDGFAEGLRLIEAAAADPRNFVRKAVSWALRAIGQRRAGLHATAIALARRLAASEDAAERWIGKDALRDLTRPQIAQRLARR